MGNMKDLGEMQKVDFPHVVPVSGWDLFRMLETIDFYAEGGNDGGERARAFIHSTPEIDIPEV